MFLITRGISAVSQVNIPVFFAFRYSARQKAILLLGISIVYNAFLAFKIKCYGIGIIGITTHRKDGTSFDSSF